MLQCVAVCCSAMQCVAVCCSVLQCVAVCCSASDVFDVGYRLWHRAVIRKREIGLCIARETITERDIGLCIERET